MSLPSTLHSSSPDFPVQGTFSAVQMARQGSPLLICARTLKETKDGRMDVCCDFFGFDPQEGSALSVFCDGLSLPYVRHGFDLFSLLT